MASALIVVDVQNDFCEGGSLAVTGGTEVARGVTRLLRGNPLFDHLFDHVVATRDHHIDPGAHFSTEPDFVDSWPAHCVVGSTGVELHPELDRSLIEAVFDKGEHAAAYSGFEGFTGGDGSIGIGGRIGLADWLRARGVDRVEIVGIATDHCVRATALDAAGNGFATAVRLDLTAGVAPATVESALSELVAAGVTIVEH